MGVDLAKVDLVCAPHRYGHGRTDRTIAAGPAFSPDGTCFDHFYSCRSSFAIMTVTYNYNTPLIASTKAFMYFTC